jgi:hypothetical protein
VGTRADFYIGRGPEAEWIGSIAFDGYPENGDVIGTCAGVQTEDLFRRRVQALEQRKDFTDPAKHGWPWPWEDSRTTDYAYAFDEGQVWVSDFGREWFAFGTTPPDEEDESAPEREKSAVFPNMRARSEPAIGTDRDSIMIFGVRK